MLWLTSAILADMSPHNHRPQPSQASTYTISYVKHLAVQDTNIQWKKDI